MGGVRPRAFIWISMGFDVHVSLTFSSGIVISRIGGSDRVIYRSSVAQRPP